MRSLKLKNRKDNPFNKKWQKANLKKRLHNGIAFYCFLIFPYMGGRVGGDYCDFFFLITRITIRMLYCN